MSRVFTDRDKGKQETKTRPNKRNNKRKNRNKDYNRKDAVLETGSRDNDPNWYFSSAELAEQSSQLSFQSMLGYSDVLLAKTPSILRIDDVMCPGMTYNVPHRRLSGTAFQADGNTTSQLALIAPGKAGVNLMAAKLYTTLSSFTGRTASYAPQDVAMMILAISSVAEVSEAIRRAFGVALTYNFRNRAVPLGLLESMGLNVPDFIEKLSIYRMRFNVAMSRINQIPLLENIAYIKKSRDIYQRIYLDDTTNMSQIFYHMPLFAYTIDETSYSGGTILHAVDWAELKTSKASLATMNDWLNQLESMITEVLESSTLNFIYADLLNMANKMNVKTWQFDYLAENYVVMPEFNMNAILQMHNLTLTGMPTYPVVGGSSVPAATETVLSQTIYITGPDIISDASTNEVIYNPLFSDSASGSNKFLTPLQWVIDMYTDKPSIEDRIEAMRFTSLSSGSYVYSTQTANKAATTLWALPDHYVARMYMYDKYSTSSTNTGRLNYNGGSVRTALDTNWAKMSSINKAPALYVYNGTDNIWLADLDYWTEIDYDYIQRLNQIMTVGLFDFRV